MMPYVQFVSWIMRDIKRNSPGHPSNRGYVVSHIGLNADSWWDELKDFDRDDEAFFNELDLGQHDFLMKDEYDLDTYRRGEDLNNSG
jgi:hypothetical protein